MLREDVGAVGAELTVDESSDVAEPGAAAGIHRLDVHLAQAQLPAQAVAGAHEQLGDGAGGDVEHPADVLVAHVLELAQRQGEAVAFGKPRVGGPHVGALVGDQRAELRVGVGRLVGSRRALDVVGGRDPRAVGAAVVDQIARRPVQVGRQVDLAAGQVVEPREDPEKGLLGDVGGVLPAPGEPVGDVVEAVLVAPEELGEGVAVAREGPAPELLVGGAGGAHGACRWGHGSSRSSASRDCSRRKSQNAA